jgi:hypothetical protein
MRRHPSLLLAAAALTVVALPAQAVPVRDSYLLKPDRPRSA